MKTKNFEAFINDEYSELSPRSQYLAEITHKADGEVVLLRYKAGWKILKKDDILIIK